MSVRTIYRPITLGIFLVLFGTPVFSQWKKISTFPQSVRSIYFLNKIGHPEIGCCGLDNGQLWKSIDTGKTWQLAFTDPSGSSISDITFKDISTGWFVTKALATTSCAVYHTTDGGFTWTSQLTSGTGFSSVFYYAPTNSVFLTEWFAGAYFTTDDGVSWNKFTALSPLNGITFTGNLTGIITFTTLAPTTLMRSQDGGLTWNPTKVPSSSTSCWQSAYQENTNDLFIFSEYTGTLTRSNDDGLTWQTVSSLGSGSQYEFSGCIRISDCGAFFTQSASIQKGFFLSTDEGRSWVNINGPSSQADTRFWIDKDKVFGADLYGTLLSFDLGNPMLALSRDTMLLISPDCRPVKARYPFEAISCIEGIDSILSINTSSKQFAADTSFHSQAFLSFDSAQIVYTPSGTGRDTGIIHLHFRLHGRIIDTSFIAIGFSPKQVHTLSVPNQLVFSPPGNCIPVDTTIDIFSYTNCSPTRDSILSVAFLTGTSFSIAQSEVIPRMFITKDSLRIHYLESGIGTDTDKILLKTLVGGKEFDTLITLIGNPASAVSPLSILGLPATLQSHDCNPADTSLTIIIKACTNGIDSIRNILVRGDAFHITTNGNIPRIFSSIDSISVIYHPVVAGTDTAVITLQLRSHGNEIDTTIIVLGKAVKPLTDFAPVFQRVSDTSCNIILSAPVTAASGLDSFDFVVRFDDQMLEMNFVASASGFTIIPITKKPGLWQCRFYNSSRSSLSANQILGSFHFSQYVTLDTISSLVMNGGDAYFNPSIHQGCPIAAIPGMDSITVFALNNCGDRTTRTFMKSGTIDISLLSVRPNPAKDELILQTLVTMPLDASIIIYDDLGRERMAFDRSFSGLSASRIPIHSLPSGIYQIRIQSDTGSVWTNFLKLQ